jgi:tetratricopeptide (TPR) repeat protein
LLLDPRNGSFYRGCAWVKSLQGRYEEALADATKAVEYGADDYVSLSLQSMLAHALGKEDLEKKARNAALSKIDEDSRAALVAWIKNESDKAFILYHGRPFEKKPPQTALDWMYRGLMRQIEEKPKDAEQDLREAIKRGGDSPELLYAYTGLSLILEQREDYKGKMELLEYWLKMQPESMTVLCNMSWELLNSKDPGLRDSKRALPLAQKASDLSKHNDAGIEDTLALALFNEGQAAKAYEVQKRAIELLPKDMLPADRESYVQHLSQYEFAKPPDP